MQRIYETSKLGCYVELRNTEDFKPRIVAPIRIATVAASELTTFPLCDCNKTRTVGWTYSLPMPIILTYQKSVAYVLAAKPNKRVGSS